MSSDELIDFTLKHPCKVTLIGPSLCGKTRFIVDFLRNRNKLLSEKIDKVLYIYCDHQPIFTELAATDPNIKFTTSLHDLETWDERPSIVVVDDFFDEFDRRENSRILTSYFVKHSHHRSVTLIVTLQAAFHPQLRVVHRNTDYSCIWDFPRDRSFVRILSSQICPGKTRFLQDAYERAVSIGDYLFLDMNPANKHTKYWARSSIYPDECEVYAP